MPVHLNVTTIYYNSIEIEWKPGGISEVLYYIVKYRPQQNSEDYDTLTSDFPRPSDSDKNMLNLVDDYSSDNDENFKSLNTTSTKLKVGTSLKPYSVYEFKVMGGNLLGVGEETDIIRVRTAATSKH